MGEEVKERKERADKKRDCKPTIPEELYQVINDVAVIVGNKPIKEVAETILEEGLKSEQVMEYFSDSFVNDFWLGQTVYLSCDLPFGNKVVRVAHPKKKITLRLRKSTCAALDNFAYAIGKTRTSAAAEILRVACTETQVLSRYVESVLVKTLDGERRKQLGMILRQINGHTGEEQISFFVLMARIVKSFKHGSRSLKDAIDEYIKEWL